jgi:hypothetical protein
MLWAAGEIEPQRVRLGSMPPRPSESMLAIARDIEVRIGLLLAEGITRALPYATQEAVDAGFVRTKGGASYALTRLAQVGVIRCIGEMPPRGKGNGTKLFVPPRWLPDDPEVFAVAVESGDHQRLADLVWIPDEPGGAARAMQPDVEVTDDPFVGGGERERIGGHGDTPTTVGYRADSTRSDDAIVSQVKAAFDATELPIKQGGGIM